jgi:hypothetical protein
LTALATPAVESGHVAGWVGVGGPGQGPGGSAEWIQVGLNSLPGTGNKLYYEVMRPGAAPSYAEVDTNVATGRPVRLAVLETAAYPGAWRIWVDGRAVTAPIALADSHGRLSPMAMGESWDGGRPACNRYSYRFEGVSIAAAPGGAWRPAREATVLQDPGYRVIKRAPASFDASATRPLPPENRAPTAQHSAQAPAAPAAPAASARPAAGKAQVVTVRAISATAPLRKGFLPAPSLDAILGVTSQPAVSQPVAAQPAAPQPTVSVTPLVAVQVTDPAVMGSSDLGSPDLGIGVVGSFQLQQEQVS